MTYSNAVFTEANQEAHANDPTTHVISAMGAVGTGKSSLLNALCGERYFEVGEAEAFVSPFCASLLLLLPKSIHLFIARLPHKQFKVL